MVQGNLFDDNFKIQETECNRKEKVVVVVQDVLGSHAMMEESTIPSCARHAAVHSNEPDQSCTHPFAEQL